MVIEPSLLASPIVTASGTPLSAAKAVIQLPAASNATNNNAVIFFIFLVPFIYNIANKPISVYFIT